jgi:hypothetical protein
VLRYGFVLGIRALLLPASLVGVWLYGYQWRKREAPDWLPCGRWILGQWLAAMVAGG